MILHQFFKEINQWWINPSIQFHSSQMLQDYHLISKNVNYSPFIQVQTPSVIGEPETLLFLVGLFYLKQKVSPNEFTHATPCLFLPTILEKPIQLFSSSYGETKLITLKGHNWLNNMIKVVLKLLILNQ